MSTLVKAQEDLRCALDPVVFGERLGYREGEKGALDQWQKDALRTTKKRIALNCHRQAGKSTVAEILACHDAVYKPPALDLIAAPGQRQANEIGRNVQQMLTSLDIAADLIESKGSQKIELVNGSRIIALPGNEATVRVYSAVTRILLDEAARVPNELYAALRPMLLTSQGGIIALSTPFGKRGWYWREWDEGGPLWHRVTWRADENPRVSREWLEEERASMARAGKGDWWFRQEYLCEWLDSQDAAFAGIDVAAAITGDVEALTLE